MDSGREKAESKGLRGSQTHSTFQSCSLCVKDFTEDTLLCAPGDPNVPVTNPILQKRSLSSESTQWLTQPFLGQ